MLQVADWEPMPRRVCPAQPRGGVDFPPYLGNGTDTNVNPGFQGDFSLLYVTTLGSQAGAATRIQEGIDALTSGGTLHVNSGTYTGNADATANSVHLARPARTRAG